MALPHTGSWGLWDFGITEGISNLLGSGVDQQGGSRLQLSPTEYQQQIATPVTQSRNNWLTSGTKTQRNGAFPTGGGNILGAATSGGGGAPTQPTNAPFNDFDAAARAEQDAQLARLNSEYDYNRSNLEGQLSSLGGQRENALSSLATEFQGVQNQVGRSKTNAKQQTDTSIQDALSTAQDTQRASRNTLRALGILNSTAAGELLQKPLTSYDTQRARLNQALIGRMGELDDFLNQKTAEHANAVRGIQQQYGDLVARIQNDLRFNDRQRADAVQSANAALMQRLAEVKQAQFNYQSQVETLKQQFAQGLSQINSYQQPLADLNAIQSQTYQAPTATSPDQVGIYGDDQKKKQGGLLSTFFGS